MSTLLVSLAFSFLESRSNDTTLHMVHGFSQNECAGFARVPIADLRFRGLSRTRDAFRHFVDADRRLDMPICNRRYVLHLGIDAMSVQILFNIKINNFAIKTYHYVG